MGFNLIYDHLIFTTLILIFFVLEVVIILTFNLKFMSCNLIMRKTSTIIYRASIYVFVILLFICTFIWRIYNRNRFIILPEIDFRLFTYKEIKVTFKSILKSLEYVEVYGEIYFYHISLFIILGALSIILGCILFFTGITYLKSRAYSAHIYFLQVKFYERIFRYIFVHLNIKINMPIDEYVGSNYANKHWFHRYTANFLFARSQWLSFVISSIILIFPIYLLFYDIYLYNGISKFYFWLPWIYLLVICRILNKLGNSTYAPRPYGSDKILSKTFYIDHEYTKFIVDCLNLNPIKLKKRKLNKKYN